MSDQPKELKHASASLAHDDVEAVGDKHIGVGSLNARRALRTGESVGGANMVVSDMFGVE